MKTLAFLVFILAVCVLSVVKASCVIDPSVKDETARTNQQTLLKGLEPLFGKRAKQLKDANGNIYDFVVCGEVDSGTHNVSITQTVPNSPKPLKVLGYNNQTTVSGQGSWLMVTFSGGDAYENSCNKTHRQAHIMFVCDPYQKELEIHTVDGNLTENTCYLLFVVRHHLVCSSAPESGLSGGTIFFILLLVTFGAYFVFGFFYLRLVKGAKGVEQIPNREFWFRIGNILADGCSAVFRCDQYCGGGGGGGGGGSRSSASSYSGYSPIEEQMARDLQDTDRDSALLHP